VNRESGDVEPLDVGGPIFAQCWPRGSTSDSPEYLQFKRTLQFDAARDGYSKAVFAMARAPPRACHRDRCSQRGAGTARRS